VRGTPAGEIELHPLERSRKLQEWSERMKAVYFQRHGGPEVLTYGDMPDPVPDKDEIVVDIHAASINGADWKVRAGLAGRVIFPHILGRDFSGVVSAVGPDVKDICAGDAVFGVCATGQEGAYAEKIAIKSALVAIKPPGLSHSHAAALALGGLTAIVAIETTLMLEQGEIVLIHGGAGGVGGFAIQLAKHLGAHVVTTTSTANRDYVRALGADETIDYRKEDFASSISDIDAVFDTVGGEVGVRSFSVLKPGGRAAFIAYGANIPPAPSADLKSLRPDVRRDRKHLQRIVDLIAVGAVRLPEVTTFALSDTARAHEISQGRHFRGKLVLLLS
jgi:NADPH:quinone reductase-like Zn-dependent oxidoreductase